MYTFGNAFFEHINELLFLIIAASYLGEEGMLNQLLCRPSLKWVFL